MASATSLESQEDPLRILVTGTSGNLGSYLVRHLRTRPGVRVIPWRGSGAGSASLGSIPVDLLDPRRVESEFQRAQPSAVIHAAGITTVADCRADRARAFAVNAAATARLAALAFERNCRFVYLSTDLVFDGRAAPYAEEAQPTPWCVYGESKLAGEAAVDGAPAGLALILRLGLLYGPTLIERPAFFDSMLRGMLAGRTPDLFRDEWRTPLPLDAAAEAIVAAVLDRRNTDELGLRRRLHVGGPERLSRHDLGLLTARYLGLDPACVRGASRLSRDTPEPRPADTSLVSSRWRAAFPLTRQPSLEAGLFGLGLAGAPPPD